MNDSVLGDVSRETIERLELFAELTRKWTPKINLISRNTVPDLWARHIVDSAQLFQYAPTMPQHWVDIGSGGGFPGLVMAAMAAEKTPQTKFTLIESDQRKSTFLRSAAREMGVEVTVISDRVESCEPQQADVLTARALSALGELFPYITRHVRPSGIAILPKGKNHAQEIVDARLHWRFDVQSYQSTTEDLARILVVKDIERD